MTQSIQQGIEPDFWSALWLSRFVCQRQMLIVRFGVWIMLETRKVFWLDNSILNKNWNKFLNNKGTCIRKNINKKWKEEKLTRQFSYMYSHLWTLVFHAVLSWAQNHNQEWLMYCGKILCDISKYSVNQLHLLQKYFENIVESKYAQLLKKKIISKNFLNMSIYSRTNFVKNISGYHILHADI